MAHYLSKVIFTGTKADVRKVRDFIITQTDLAINIENISGPYENPEDMTIDGKKYRRKVVLEEFP